MKVRSASVADLAAITDLQLRWDVAAFGAPEHDEGEVREELDHIGSFDDDSRVVFDGEQLIAAAWQWSTEATILVDPDVDPTPVYAELLPWFELRRTPALPALSTDQRLRSALADRGWRYTKSVFELLRATGSDWAIPEPRWDDGITVRDYRSVDGPAVHHLIYVDADWAGVPGHHRRELAEWLGIFVTEVTEATEADHQVLAWRGDRLVGVAMGRMYSGNVGWIAQLAVAIDERGRGLGRALLLEALRRRAVAGAVELGLGVVADNQKALQLYLDVGLRVVREWQDFQPPG
jgi:ribosomal protein S18 acetylase RimI-like enzyme